MSNSLFEFNYQHDQQPTENQYPINDVQWIYINDINQQNYSNGYINFTRSRLPLVLTTKRLPNYLKQGGVNASTIDADRPSRMAIQTLWQEVY